MLTSRNRQARMFGGGSPRFSLLTALAELSGITRFQRERSSSLTYPTNSFAASHAIRISRQRFWVALPSTNPGRGRASESDYLSTL